MSAPALRRDEQLALLDAFFESAPVGLGFWDTDLRFVRLNRALARINGRSVRECLGRRVEEVVPDAVASSDMVAAWRRILATGQPMLDVPVSAPDPTAPGGVRHWSDNWFPVRIGDRVVGVAATVMDVTHRRQTEAELAASEQRFATAFHACPLGLVISVLEDGRVLDINDACCALLEYPRARLLGVRLSEAGVYAKPEDRQRLMARLLAGEPVRDVELPIRTGTGRRITLLVSMERIDLGGQPCVLSFAVDVTARKLAEETLRRAHADLEAGVRARTAELQAANEALHESRARFEAIFEAIPDGIVFADPETLRFVLCNEAFARLVGCPREEVTGLTVLDVCPPERHARARETFGQMLAGEALPGGDRQLLRRDGTRLQVELRALHVHLGGRTYVAGLFRDVTARLQAEEELLARSRQLAQLASDLTVAEHRERRLLAERLHDQLQQLLFGARLQAQALLASAEPAARAPLDTLLATLGEALAFAQDITRELAPPSLLKGDLSAALHWLARELEARCRLAVRLRVPPRVPDMPEAVTVLVYTAARELLFNVAKHAGTNRATLQLDLHDHGLVLDVRDDGCGFDPDAVGGKTRDHGLGLFSIRERTALMGGTLVLQSRPGHGTRATLAMPLPTAPTAGPAESDAGPAAAGDATPVRRGRRRGIRLVLADDHRTVREGLIALLQADNAFTVVGQADNGQQAVACVERCRPDLVVLDVGMPVLDGISATRVIRQRFPDVGIVGLSMYEDAAIRARMCEAGADDYVTKSADPEQLIATLRRVAGLRRP